MGFNSGFKGLIYFGCEHVYQREYCCAKITQVTSERGALTVIGHVSNLSLALSVCVFVCSCEFPANIVLTTTGFRDVTVVGWVFPGVLKEHSAFIFRVVKLSISSNLLGLFDLPGEGTIIVKHQQLLSQPHSVTSQKISVSSNIDVRAKHLNTHNWFHMFDSCDPKLCYECDMAW